MSVFPQRCQGAFLTLDTAMSLEGPLLRLSRGETAACRECVERYGNLVWSIARRFTTHRADAEDVVQEIFLNLWQSAARYDPALGSETTFVAMIARRRVVDWRRRQSASRPAVHVALDEIDDANVHRLAFFDDEHSPDADLALRTLQSLRPEYRRVLELAFCHGLTQSEIATHLLAPLGTVKSAMRRGLLEIRAILNGTESGEAGAARLARPLPLDSPGIAPAWLGEPVPDPA